jgi:hypothetical protein
MLRVPGITEQGDELGLLMQLQICEVESSHLHSRTHTGKTNLLQLKRKEIFTFSIRTELVVPGWQPKTTIDGWMCRRR